MPCKKVDITVKIQNRDKDKEKKEISQLSRQFLRIVSSYLLATVIARHTIGKPRKNVAKQQ